MIPQFLLLSETYGCVSGTLYAEAALGCTETLISEDERERLCVCDTPLCNDNPFEIGNFSCYADDLEIARANEINKTVSCYTNRNQCFQMQYSGTTLYC